MERQGERAAEQAPAIDQAPPVAAPEPAVLSLQRKIGNRAVTTLLSRDEETSETQTSYAITLEGIGTIPLESFSWGISKDKTVKHKDVSVTSKTGKHSSELWRRAASGERIKTGKIVVRRGSQTVTIELKDMYISSFQTGGSPGDEAPVEMWSMSVGDIKVTTAPTREGGTTTLQEWELAPDPG